MKGWHDLLVLVLPAGSGLVWPLSIVLLVLTVRLVLLRPIWQQLVAARRSQLLNPRIAELKRRHRGDTRAYLQATQELRRDEGIGVGASLWPLLLQIPVFLGLYHLLVGFSTAGGGGNGIFRSAEVASFAHAGVAGVPLGAAIRTPLATLLAWSPDLTRWDVVSVVGPLLVIAAAATFVNAWRAQRRQARMGPATPADDQSPLATSLTAQLTTVGRLMVWLAPMSLLVGGVIFPLPLAVVVYSAVNGIWTTVQTQVMTARLDRLLPVRA